MKRKIFLLCVTLLSCMALYAQIPSTITYQGYLTDATGKPKSGTHKLAFNFYDGSTIVATRTISSVNVVNGLFTEIIGKDASGENASLPLTIWGKPITVGITVDTETELPKISLTSMPYAFASQVANSVDGANITGTVNASKIGGTLIASNIPVLDASKITTGTLANTLLDADLQDLADGSLTGSKVGAGISAVNVTTGTLPSTVLDADIADLADGTLTTLNVTGYSQLGSTAPIIQIKKLTGTTGAAEGDEVGIAHGLTATKILSIEVMVSNASGIAIHQGYTNGNENQFNWYLTATEIRVFNTAGNSGNILSKPIRILITYEQ